VDVSEKPMMGMLDLFYVRTLTFVRMIETLVDSDFATVLRMIRSSGSFFSFGENG
jgi:hypothetical protein